MTDGQTDRRTDRILLAIPRLHYMQRGKKEHGLKQATAALQGDHSCVQNISSVVIDDSMSFSDARAISAFIHSLHMVDGRRFLMIRSLLGARSAEQLVTATLKFCSRLASR